MVSDGYPIIRFDLVDDLQEPLGFLRRLADGSVEIPVRMTRFETGHFQLITECRCQVLTTNILMSGRVWELWREPARSFGE